MKAENKTVPTNNSVSKFIDAIPDEGRKQDCRVLLEMMESMTGEGGVMWGDAIVGFGLYHYVYATGREGDMPKVGFSPAEGRFFSSETGSNALSFLWIRKLC